MTDGKEDPAVFTTTCLPSDQRLFATVTNAYLGTRVYRDILHVNGVYNGAVGDTHRANVPSPLNVRMTVPGADSLAETFTLNARTGTFSHVLQSTDYTAIHQIYAHHSLVHLMAFSITIRRSAHTGQPITVQLQAPFVPKSQDLDLHRGPEFQGARYVYGTTLVPEVEGGPQPTVHMLWTPVPQDLTLCGEEQERSWEFLTAVAESEEEVKRNYSEGLALIASGSLHSSHIHAWDALWQGCCIDLDGPLPLRQALYGCLYYLLSAIPPRDNPGFLFHGISPGGLSNGTQGEDYWGHVFWDQDTWVFPNILLFYPEAARAILEYRIRMLEGALHNAEEQGYKGAKFPWESAATGQEVCPEDIYGAQEIHITGDVLMAFEQYYYTTQDQKLFREDGGWKLVGAVAQYWCSRMVWSEEEQCYHIRAPCCSQDTPQRPLPWQYKLMRQDWVLFEDCFSMANISWYGGASIRDQHWPFNSADSPAQPFVSGDFGKNPTGYGPVLERYFLGSTGVTVTVAPDVPFVLSLESNQHFCLGSAGVPLQYLLCISSDVATAHRHVGTQLVEPARVLPDTTLLGSPIWHYYGPVGSAAKIKRGLRSLTRRLKRHQLQEGVLALGERSTATLTATEYVSMEQRRRRSSAHAWDPALINPLQLSITLSPYTSIASPLFLRSLRDNEASYWLSLQPRFGGCLVPLLTTWKGRLCARLNVTSEAALSWYLARARALRRALGATYVVFEGAEGNAFLEQAMSPPAELAGDRYAGALAAALATLGNATVISAGARSSHLPLFVQMSPRRSDWSHAGLKGVIPSALHYSLLGYNFFIPDAVGGSLAGDAPGDQELYVRWLQIVTFLPVMAFSTPPWLCCNTWVLNLTRQCIQRHRDLVVPLILKYSEEWLRLGYPIFRPAWWLSPTDPTAFTIEDEFLIGDEVLVAPITEKGQTWRDIYLPGEGHQWMDTNTARVFDGGTILRNYSASLEEVPVFVKTS